MFQPSPFLLGTQINKKASDGSMEIHTIVSVHLCLRQPIRSLYELNTIEAIMQHKDMPQRYIYQFYKALLTLQSPGYPDYISHWESDLQIRFTDEQKDKVIQLSYMSATSCKMEEVTFKFLTR